jgi:hypothetical protein
MLVTRRSARSRWRRTARQAARPCVPQATFWPLRPHMSPGSLRNGTAGTDATRPCRRSRNRRTSASRPSRRRCVAPCSRTISVSPAAAPNHRTASFSHEEASEARPPQHSPPQSSRRSSITSSLIRFSGAIPRASRTRRRPRARSTSPSTSSRASGGRSGGSTPGAPRRECPAPISGASSVQILLIIARRSAVSVLFLARPHRQRGRLFGDSRIVRRTDARLFPLCLRRSAALSTERSSHDQR